MRELGIYTQNVCYNRLRVVKLMQSVVVFAFESEEFGHQGQRKYLVTTYYHFSRRYL